MATTPKDFFANQPNVAGEIAERIEAIHRCLVKQPIDFANLRSALVQLLVFLSGPGRTEANCTGVDAFYSQDETWIEAELPDAYHDIFADMSGALHDTTNAPAIAENFDSTPEQLLERLKQL